MRSAPVSCHVGNGLKADITSKGWNGKTVIQACNFLRYAKQVRDNVLPAV
jgi:hypothetical protein